MSSIARLVFLLHQPLPRVTLRGPAVGGVKGAIGILEYETNRITIASAVAESFGEPTSKHVEEMQYIALADRVVAQKPAGLVAMLRAWCLRSRALVDVEKLMIEYPFGTYFVVCVVA